MISYQIKQKIIDNTDIVEVIKEYVVKNNINRKGYKNHEMDIPE